MNREQTIERLVSMGVKEEKARSFDLVGASLVGASLVGANLVGANLVWANLGRASLVGASLDGASLVGASLVGANLVGASLVGANLEWANLVGANNIVMSHDCAAEILRRGAQGNIRILSFAGFLLVRRDWCWQGFLGIAEREWSDVLDEIKRILFADPAWGFEAKYNEVKGGAK